MDQRKLELLFSVAVAVLRLIVLAQKAGLLVRGRASAEIREQIQIAVLEAESILDRVKEYSNES